ncbi:MAG: hypothetical protein GF308_19535 [Candidatus Heimdallarchaeota archaeon]|nr:hypothetical protein [Candidatus Heimdallarchaeota archaeon]
MSARGKFLSLKNQLFILLGFIILFLGLLFHFYGDGPYPMFRTFKNLFFIADCIGGFIIVLSLSWAFLSHRGNLEEAWKPLVIESSLTFAFSFSLQAAIFHILFNKRLPPVNLGVFFIFLAYLFVITSLLLSLVNFLFSRYFVILVPVIDIVSVGTTISGVFLTFTGSIDQITSEGIGVLSLGIFSILSIIIAAIFYPKWKFLLADDEDEEDEINEEDKEEDNEEAEF